MPNNPGRIAGDYSIGEKEEIKYIDPGSFGAIKSRSTIPVRLYILALGFIVLVALIIIAYFVGL